MKLTCPTALLLQALARGSQHGFDIMDATDLPSGTVYPVLRRLDGESLAASRWEKQAGAQKAQRPPRRCYRLTAAGEALLAQTLVRCRALDDVRPAAARARAS